MRIYFCCGNALMPQHKLNSPKVSSILQQMGSKRMPKGVRTDSFSQPYGSCCLFYYGKDHRSGELFATPIEKYYISKFLHLRDFLALMLYIVIYLFLCILTDRYQALFVSLTQYSYKSFFEKKV